MQSHPELPPQPWDTTLVQHTITMRQVCENHYPPSNHVNSTICCSHTARHIRVQLLPRHHLALPPTNHQWTPALFHMFGSITHCSATHSSSTSRSSASSKPTFRQATPTAQACLQHVSVDTSMSSKFPCMRVMHVLMHITYLLYLLVSYDANMPRKSISTKQTKT